MILRDYIPSDCKTLAELFFNTVKNTNNLVVGFSLIDDKPADNQTAEVYEQAFFDKFGTTIDDRREKYIYPSKYGSFSMFPQQYFAAVKNTGSVNSTRSPSNGYLTFNDLIISLKKKYYPSLSLKAAIVASMAKAFGSAISSVLMARLIL